MTKIEDRVLKLIRLAGQQDNENEAAVAFAHAQKLATIHGLDLHDLMDQNAEETVPEPREVDKIVKRKIENWDKAVSWKTTIAGAVARANSCKIYLLRGRHGVKGFGGIVAYGQESDLAVVDYVYKAIVAECEKVARRAVKRYKEDPDLDPRWDDSPRMYGRNFRLGFADKIRSRMPTAREAVKEVRGELNGERQRALAAGESLATATTALVRVNQAEEYLDRVDTALAKAAKSYGLRAGPGFQGAGGSGNGYSDGRRAGARANLGNNGKALGA